jgi:hypothetical protein
MEEYYLVAKILRGAVPTEIVAAVNATIELALNLKVTKRRGARAHAGSDVPSRSAHPVAARHRRRGLGGEAAVFVDWRYQKNKNSHVGQLSYRKAPAGNAWSP